MFLVLKMTYILWFDCDNILFFQAYSYQNKSIWTPQEFFLTSFVINEIHKFKNLGAKQFPKHLHSLFSLFCIR